MPGNAPPSRAGPHPPKLDDAAEGRAPLPVGERAGATSAGGGPLPRGPLTTNR